MKKNVLFFGILLLLFSCSKVTKIDKEKFDKITVTEEMDIDGDFSIKTLFIKGICEDEIKVLYKAPYLIKTLKLKDGYVFNYGFYGKNKNELCYYSFIKGDIRSFGSVNMFFNGSENEKYLMKDNFEKYQVELFSLQTGKKIKKIDVKKLIENQPLSTGSNYMDGYFKDDKFVLMFKDSWDEIYEQFEINLNTFDVIRIPVVYSKKDLKNTDGLPSLH